MHLKGDLKSMLYKSVVCGGTFDRLHKGHKRFLEHVFAVGEKVVIGLTSDFYIKTYKDSNHIESFEIRKNNLEQFLKGHEFASRAEIISIDDMYGKTLDSSYSFDAIVVSEETVAGAEQINKARQDVGMSSLVIITVPLLETENGDILSSTLIREGKVGKNGEIFLDKKWTDKVLFLPVNLRHHLHQPFGELLPGDIPLDYLKNPKNIVSVGDRTTKRLHDLGIRQHIAVVDFFVERKQEYHSLKEEGFTGDEIVYEVHNPAGSLTPEVWQACQQVSERMYDNTPCIIKVTGEEDLLVIPLVLALPLGVSLFYGQPKEGLVRLVISEELKERIFAFLRDFTHE